MNFELGRFFEGHLHEVTQMLRVLHDFCTGQGADVNAWVDGRQLVFGTGTPHESAGFLRCLPHGVSVTISFPRGADLNDPAGRAKGVLGSRTKLTIRTTADLDAYVRRMIDAAYVLDAG